MGALCDTTSAIDGLQINENKAALNFPCEIASAKISLLNVCEVKGKIIDRRACRFMKRKLH